MREREHWRFLSIRCFPPHTITTNIYPRCSTSSNGLTTAAPCGLATTHSQVLSLLLLLLQIVTTCVIFADAVDSPSSLVHNMYMYTGGEP